MAVFNPTLARKSAAGADRCTERRRNGARKTKNKGAADALAECPVVAGIADGDLRPKRQREEVLAWRPGKVQPGYVFEAEAAVIARLAKNHSPSSVGLAQSLECGFHECAADACALPGGGDSHGANAKPTDGGGSNGDGGGCYISDYAALVFSDERNLQGVGDT